MLKDKLIGANYVFTLEGQEKELTITTVYCIGYSGRDKRKVQEHIDELAELGVPRPEEVPMLYPVRVANLNQGGGIEVLGQETSGEAEIVLIFGEDEEEVYITVGSDHTDRGLETVDINKSKQICDKPLARKVWLLSEVIDHWDQLKLVSKVLVNEKWELYQEQEVTAMLPLEEIFGYLKKKSLDLKHTVVFAGTVPLVNGFKYGQGYEVKLVDPVKNDSISCEYRVFDLER